MSAPGVALLVAFIAFIAFGCRQPPPSLPPSAPAPVPRPRPLSLPDVPGFTAGATSRGDGYVRRLYTRERVRVEVTLARMQMSPEDYASWVRTSTAGFPQAALELPPEEGNGFYQCSDGPPVSCDLLVQLRAGVHLELRGGGTSSRADVDALARGLPLRALAAPPSN